MYHPLLLQPEVLRDLPALLEDRHPRQPEPPAVLTYRSEAFAEDLYGDAAPAAAGGLRVALLSLLPTLVVLVSAGVSVFA
jgi:hypothetical protein